MAAALDSTPACLSPHSMPSTEPQPQAMPRVHAVEPNGASEPAVPARPHQYKHVWVITGPAGCGKSTVAQYLAQQLSLPYIEGDEFHPPANIDKMAAGIPLDDADRWDWLILLRQQALQSLTYSQSVGGPAGVVLTCSALKRKYRDVIRVAAYNNPHVRVHFVYLRATEELLLQRVRARQGHYMKDSMVKSQFASLEEPMQDEVDCLVIGVGGAMPEVQALALNVVKDTLAATAG